MLYQPAIDRYRKKVTSHKTKQVDQLLQQYPTDYSEDANDILKLINILYHLEENIELVLDHIHDLWSETLFEQGYQYAPVTSKARKQHSLLKPLLAFTAAEKEREALLAKSDMHSIRKAVCLYYPEIFNQWLQQHSPQVFEIHQVDKIIQLVCHLALDRKFLTIIGPYIHQSWIDCNEVIGLTSRDSRQQKQFHQLDTEDKVITLKNAKTDMLAVGLYAQSLTQTLHFHNYSSKLSA